MCYQLIFFKERNAILFLLILVVRDAREALLEGVPSVLGVNVLNKLNILLGKTNLKLTDRADGELGRRFLSLSDLTSLGGLLLSQLAKILGRLRHVFFIYSFYFKKKKLEMCLL